MISSVAPDVDGVVHNVNADTAAAALAIALGAEKLLVLTDVEGLYRDWPDSDDVIQEISPEALDGADADPRRRAWCPRWAPACEAVDGGVPRATVVDGREPHAVLLEIFTDEGVGTQVLPGVDDQDPRRRTRRRGGRHDATCKQRYAASLMNTFGPPQAGAHPRRGRPRLGRRRQAVRRPARRHRRQRARPRPPGAGRGRHHPARHARATSPTSSPAEPQVDARRAAARRCSAPTHGQGVLHQLRRRGQRGRVQADPAHRPHPRSSPPRAPSTAAPWARSR